MTSYRTTEVWLRQPCETLADILAPDLVCVFVGLNPSPVSVAAGHYMRGTLGRQFWRLLDTYGILPAPANDRFPDEVLLDYGFGFTDLAKCPTPRANALTRADIEAGREILRAKVGRYGPKILCSVYKSTIEQLMDKKYPRQCGLLPDRFGETLLFAAPFPYRPALQVALHMGELKALIDEARN